MYENIEDSKKAIEALSQAGYQCSFAKESMSGRLKNLQDPNSTNIYISNLPLDMDEKGLEELFSPHQVISTRILRDANQTSRGVGFARMADREAAIAVITRFNQTTLPNGPAQLQVRFADSLAQKRLKGQSSRRKIMMNHIMAPMGGAYGMAAVPAAMPGMPPHPGQRPVTAAAATMMGYAIPTTMDLNAGAAVVRPTHANVSPNLPYLPGDPVYHYVGGVSPFQPLYYPSATNVPLSSQHSPPFDPQHTGSSPNFHISSPPTTHSHQHTLEKHINNSISSPSSVSHPSSPTMNPPSRNENSSPQRPIQVPEKKNNDINSMMNSLTVSKKDNMDRGIDS